MEPKVETYNKRAVCCSLNDFDPILDQYLQPNRILSRSVTGRMARVMI